MGARGISSHCCAGTITRESFNWVFFKFYFPRDSIYLNTRYEAPLSPKGKKARAKKKEAAPKKRGSQVFSLLYLFLCFLFHANLPLVVACIVNILSHNLYLNENMTIKCHMTISNV
jgi:hypothetical protein